MVDEEAHKRLSLFPPFRNRQWKVMPMGALNSDSKFEAMMMKLKMEWETLARERGLKMLYQKLLLILCYCMGAQLSRS